LRVVSANLLNGNVDPAWLRDLVREMRADVVVTQEADPRHYDALAEDLPHGHFEEGAYHTGMGISLKRPAAFARVPLAWRAAHEALLAPEDWPELSRPLEIMNLHVAAPHVYRPPFYGFLLRRKQVAQLVEHFQKPSGAKLVIGDFNATPHWPVYKNIAEHFTDAAIAVAQQKGTGVEPTWGFPDKKRRLRLDHAMTRGVCARDFHVVALEGSDHSAIVVDLAG
jgi:endonuclease/exonuclease/phosphatase family metal-dependent hydrolase